MALRFNVGDTSATWSNMQLTIYPESHRRPTRTPTRNAVTDYVPGRQRCRPLFLA